MNAQADLDGFLFSSMLPFLDGVQQIETTKTKARAGSVTSPIEVVLAIDVSESMNSALDGGWHPVDPEDDANSGARKAIVLLTDGEHNPCGLHDPTCSTNDVGFVRDVACTAAKAAGTEIFVVAAMHPDNVPRNLGTALRACSSEADNSEGSYTFFDNSDAESLRAAFADIANQLVTVGQIY